jgi:xanthine dehydrogenase YagS FAD-binding subunit
VNKFEIVTPASLADASKLLAQKDHIAIAGGVDVVDLLKLNLLAPKTIVNLKGLKELDGIRTDSRGLRLGALTKLHAVATHPEILERYTALAEAAAEAATPQIRNLGTVGGNLLQRPRCWYFRHPDVQCLKKGGDKCYSIAGLNRYNAILGGGPSYIVHPSNLAPALIAMGARARLAGPSGDRTVELEKFFTLPTVDATRENVTRPGEVIVEVIVPPPSEDTNSTYIEAREKQSFDWPLVSVAAVLIGSRTIHDARIVMGAVAPIPWRAPEAEAALKGAPLDIARAKAAAEVALKDAQPMSDNAYKVTIAKVMVRRAILRAGDIQET